MPLAKKVDHVNGHVTGLDLQPEMIEKTELKAEIQLIKNIDFISGSIEQVSINQTYDIILMVCVLGEIPKKTHPTVVKKLAAHLTSNGIISITETIFDPHFQKYKTVLLLMKENGFVQTKYKGNCLAYTAHFKKIQ